MTVGYPEFLSSSTSSAGETAFTRRKPARNGLYRRFAKRVMDTVLVVASAPVVLPVVGVMALAVAVDGANPFYTQQRIGKGGRSFRIWKLRTMVPNADKRLAEMLAADPEAKAEWDATQKLRNDPRVTRVGSFLRRSSMDELPQLWNVLRGDMSLVGPRPMMPEQRRMYPGTSYYAMRPGITGLWQTEGRNDTTFAARADYDARYDQEVSLGKDLRILARTVGVVLRGTGH